MRVGVWRFLFEEFECVCDHCHKRVFSVGTPRGWMWCYPMEHSMYRAYTCTDCQREEEG